MLYALLLALAPAAHAACEAPAFTFTGQPACVDLAFDGTRTQLQNACEHDLLVDQSVRTGDAGGPMVPAGATVALRDLSAFTVGLDGELYRVVAVVDASACDATASPPAAAPLPEAAAAAPAEASWVQGILGVVLPGLGG